MDLSTTTCDVMYSKQAALLSASQLCQPCMQKVPFGRLTRVIVAASGAQNAG